jgi:hypothetical protein
VYAAHREAADKANTPRIAKRVCGSSRSGVNKKPSDESDGFFQESGFTS